ESAIFVLSTKEKNELGTKSPDITLLSIVPGTQPSPAQPSLVSIPTLTGRRRSRTRRVPPFRAPALSPPPPFPSSCAPDPGSRTTPTFQASVPNYSP
ncbi:hypothetical protein EJB05_16813, partial [Eragrostis curvula]